MDKYRIAELKYKFWKCKFLDRRNVLLGHLLSNLKKCLNSDVSL